jgi:hypothetical protein
MRDPVANVRVRKAAMALAEVADTAGQWPTIAARPAVRAVLEERRAAVRILIPRLEAARTDVRRWDALADELAGHWDAMREAYLKSAVNPAVNARLVATMNEMTGVK